MATPGHGPRDGTRTPSLTRRRGRPMCRGRATGTPPHGPCTPFTRLRRAPAVPEQAAASSSGTEAGHMRQDRSIVGFVPYLAVLVCAVVGVYIAWREGSAGGGDGAAVLGAALLAAAVARLLLPARLARLLATRKRATDVLTLTVFGARPACRGPGTAAIGPRPVSSPGCDGGSSGAGARHRFPLAGSVGILMSRRIFQSRSWQRDGRDHLHQNRRGAAACDVFLPPDRLRLRP